MKKILANVLALCRDIYQLFAPPSYPTWGEGGAVVGDMTRKYGPRGGANVTCTKKDLGASQRLCILPRGHFCHDECVKTVVQLRDLAKHVNF